MNEGLPRLPLTETQEKIFNLARIGWTPSQIAGRMGTSAPSIHDAMYKIKDRGWTI